MSRAAKHDTEPDFDPATGETLYDSKGNPITREYLDDVSAEAEAGYDLTALTPARGRLTRTSARTRCRLPRSRARRRSEGGTSTADDWVRLLVPTVTVTVTGWYPGYTGF